MLEEVYRRLKFACGLQATTTPDLERAQVSIDSFEPVSSFGTFDSVLVSFDAVAHHCNIAHPLCDYNFQWIVGQEEQSEVCRVETWWPLFCQ
jgi:hypothetical protein